MRETLRVRKERAILVAVILPNDDGDNLTELTSLAESAGAIVIDRLQQKIKSPHPSIYIGKCLYRGTLQLVKTKDETLTAVNILDIEDYVKGVLYHEISHRWPLEAIKAQAIAARTFAIYQAQQRSNEDFYLNADVSSQVYRGVFAEKFRTNKAVDETAGQILMYKRKVLPAFFHATCGGRAFRISNSIRDPFKAGPTSSFTNMPSPHRSSVRMKPLEILARLRFKVSRSRAWMISR